MLMPFYRYANSAIARHTFEAYDNTEGQAEQAIRNAHALQQKGSSDSSSDEVSSGHGSGIHKLGSKLTSLVGKNDKEEQAIDKAHQKSLSSRHRGSMQYRPVRTTVWMKEGLSRRAKELKSRITGQVDKEGE